MKEKQPSEGSGELSGYNPTDRNFDQQDVSGKPEHISPAGAGQPEAAERERSEGAAGDSSKPDQQRD